MSDLCDSAAGLILRQTTAYKSYINFDSDLRPKF